MKRLFATTTLLLALTVTAMAQTDEPVNWWQNIWANYVSPAALPVIGTFVAGVIAWIAGWFKAKLNVDIEAKWREALHSAIMSGIQFALEKIGGLKAASTTANRDTVVKLAESWVQKSVPDAVTGLAATPEKIQHLAMSKLQGMLDNIMVGPTGDPVPSDRPVVKTVARRGK